MDEQLSIRQRVLVLVSWLGPIVVGIFFLVGGSVYARTQTARGNLTILPRAGVRTVALAVGGDAVPETLPPSKPSVPLIKNATSTLDSPFTAESIIALDDYTDTILFEKNSEAIRPLASISKLLTSLVLVDLPVNWTSTTVITASDWDGSSHHLNVGEKFTLEDLFHVALIGSSNTAINALERNSGLTSTEFVALLNAKAQELRLFSVHMVEPTGLSDQNVGNARDTARLLKEALSNERILRILEQGEYYAKPLGQAKLRRVWSTNWLLTKWIPSDFSTDHIVGKTGYINSSLYNVAVRLENDNHHLIRVVVLGSATNESRFTEARDVGEWIFDHYLWPEDFGYAGLIE